LAKAIISQVVFDSGKRDEENQFARVALVVNAWRDISLGERGTNDKPWFPSNIDEMARPAGVVLIRTDVLLEALRHHWANNDGIDILRNMLSATGTFELA